MSLIEFRTSRGKKEESGFEIENPVNIINCLFSKTEKKQPENNSL